MDDAEAYCRKMLAERVSAMRKELPTAGVSFLTAAYMLACGMRMGFTLRFGRSNAVLMRFMTDVLKRLKTLDSEEARKAETHAKAQLKAVKNICSVYK